MCLCWIEAPIYQLISQSLEGHLKNDTCSTCMIDLRVISKYFNTLLIASGKSFIYSINKIDPSTLPWITPERASSQVELLHFTETFCFLSYRKSSIQPNKLPFIPFEDIFLSNLWWLTFSKVFARISGFILFYIHGQICQNFQYSKYTWSSRKKTNKLTVR